MIASIIVMAGTSADAIHYVEQHLPDVLAKAAVQRVFEVEHVIVNWPTGTVSIAEAHHPKKSSCS
jgi:hypothetical protein